VADIGLHGGLSMDPVAKRIVASWIATDIIWASLFVYALKRAKA
jgi:hypothetical protein